MKLAEERKTLRGKNPDELNTELLRLRREQFTLRMQKASGQLGQTNLIIENRLAIARLKTILTEKRANG